MHLRILLFAGAKMAAGSDSVTIDVEPPVTAADVLERLAAEHPQLQGLTRAGRLAIDGRYAAGDDSIATDSEIAFIPPVSGG